MEKVPLHKGMVDIQWKGKCRRLAVWDIQGIVTNAEHNFSR